MTVLAAYRANGRVVERADFYAVACDPRRSVVVEACAGAGKTWMLVSRVLRALLDGAAPHEILAITFTRKAAGEMRDRLTEWLREFGSTHTSEQTRIEALIARGLAPKDAVVLAPRLQALHERVLRDGRAVQISTFHAWFAQLLRAAPLELLNELGLQPDVELIEDLDDHRPEVMRRFHAAILRDAGLRADHARLVATRGRSQALAWFNTAWSRRVEIELADAAGVLEDSVAAPPGAPAHPAAALLSAPWRAMLGDLAAALGLGGALARNAADELVDALMLADATAVAIGRATAQAMPEANADSTAALQPLFDAVWIALFTQKNAPRKLGTLDLLEAAQAGLQAMRSDFRQFDARQEHLRMVRLSRTLLAELAAYKRERGLAEMADLESCGLALLRDATLSAWVQERLDARIRHVLVDEFQDTSPLQWHALHAWLAGYAGAGGGASGQRGMSVFIVGDPKQSIYRFRRAEPRVFAAARDFVVDALGGDVLECDHTRRNAPEVLSVLNTVFEQAERFGEFEGFREHTTELQALESVDAESDAGVFMLPRVVRPPRSARSAAAAALVWRDSLTTPRVEPEEVLREHEALRVSQAIRELVETGSARPAEVLVLSRKRESLRLVAAALRHQNLPYAAVEDTRLMDAPEARDLVALLDVLVSTTHRLSLAQVLRSPLFGAGDADLIALAQRADGGDWWRALVGVEEGTDDFAALGPALQRARTWLPRWRARAQQLPPHDLLDRIVHEGEVRERFAATVPTVERPAALAAIDALLAQALTLDGARYATPYNFVRALKRRALKAAVPRQVDAVQLLTVHGAKGLEAKVVFVMDTEPQPTNPDTTTLLVDWPVESESPRTCAFVYAESACPPSLAGLLAAEVAARQREELNGLYVAMSRAKQRLVFSATEPSRPASTRSWWARVEPLAVPWRVSRRPIGADGVASLDTEGAVLLRTIAPLPISMPMPDRASGASSGRRPVFDEAGAQIEAEADTDTAVRIETEATRLGHAVHRALEWATAAAPAVAGAALANLSRAAAAEFAADPAATLQLVRRILDSTECACFFGGTALRWAANEVPIGGAGGTAQRIDRLVELDDGWWVLDYKLNHAPQELAEYREQLLGYRAAVRLLQPDAAIRCAFITSRGAVIEID